MNLLVAIHQFISSQQMHCIDIVATRLRNSKVGGACATLVEGNGVEEANYKYLTICEIFRTAGEFTTQNLFYRSKMIPSSKANDLSNEFSTLIAMSHQAHNIY